MNLFDLRPGRAIKVTLGAGALLALTGRGAQAAAAPAGRGGRAAARGPGRAGHAGRRRGQRPRRHARHRGRGVAAPAGPASRCSRRSSGLTAASEVVSFTKVIARTPPLNWVDMLGRRPAGPARPRPGRAGRGRRPRGRRPGPRHRSAGRDPRRRPAPRRSDRAGRAGHAAARRSRAPPRPSVSAGIGRAAALIAALTVLARLLGPGPAAGLRAHRRVALPGHRLRDRQPGAQHHLRHRPGRRPDQHHGPRPGPARPPVGGRPGPPRRRSGRPRRPC